MEKVLKHKSEGKSLEREPALQSAYLLKRLDQSLSRIESVNSIPMLAAAIEPLFDPAIVSLRSSPERKLDDNTGSLPFET